MEAQIQDEEKPDVKSGSKNGAVARGNAPASKTEIRAGFQMDKNLQKEKPAEMAGSAKPEGADPTSRTSIPNVKQLFNELTQEAAERVGTVPVEPGVKLGDQNRRALLLVELIRSAENRAQNLRAIQAWAVVEASRHQIWLWYPVTPDAPQGVANLRDFLELAGMDRREIYSMNLLGTAIVPYCDHHNLEITSLVKYHYPKLVEVIPHLGRQIRDDESTPGDIKGTLDAVRRMRSREHMRDWRRLEPIKDLVATGAVHHLSDGRATVTLVVKSKDDLDRVVPRLGRAVRWDLVAGVRLTSHVVHIKIEDDCYSLRDDDATTGAGAAPKAGSD